MGDWTKPMPQSELLRDTADQLRRISDEVRSRAGQLSTEQLAWSPPEGGWGVGQVLAHLATTNASYLDRLPVALEGARRAGGGSNPQQWRPSFFGGLLIRSLDPDSTRRVPTPRGWRPQEQAPRDALPRFLESHDQLAALAEGAQGVDLNRARLSSPASRLVRLNAGDAFRTFVVHGWRHLAQIDRVLSHSDFPAAAIPEGQSEDKAIP